VTLPAPKPLLLLEYSSGLNDNKQSRSVATITLNDPDRRNALGNEMFTALENALKDIQKNCAANPFFKEKHSPVLGEKITNQFTPSHKVFDDFTTRVVVLCANGPSFCAGFDLRSVANDADGAQPVLADYLRRLHQCVEIISQLPAITIASVSGAALAGGCALVSSCDFVVATPDAKFGYPTHAIGLSPSISAPTLSSRMGLGAARELLLGGQFINGTRAFELGFASHVADASSVNTNITGRLDSFTHQKSLAQETSKLINTLLAKGPHALLTTKCWLQNLDPISHQTNRTSALSASSSGVGGTESVDRVAAVWKQRS
jgi:methylglutaconyl-CoA hydratase